MSVSRPPGVLPKQDHITCSPVRCEFHFSGGIFYRFSINLPFYMIDTFHHVNHVYNPPVQDRACSSFRGTFRFLSVPKRSHEKGPLIFFFFFLVDDPVVPSVELCLAVVLQ